MEKIPWDLVNPVEIGQGAFGVVYRATADKELGRPVYAVKKISVDSFKYYYYRHNEGCVNGWIATILREVEALKNLTNDNVVKYYRCQFQGESADDYNNGDISQVTSESDFTSGQADKRLTFFYIQMEYCNSDLRKWLTQRKSLGTRFIPEIHEIFLQSLTALQYIHEKQITHRDLKPENIFIVETKNSMRIKIGDFGLATCNLNDLNDKREVGTKIYRSPEMNSKFDSRDFKTDIYSLGLVFLECIDPDLNDRMKREMVFTKILLGSYKFPEFIWARFSYEVELIRNMTTADKEERFGAKQALEYFKEKVTIFMNGDLCTSSYMRVSCGPSSSQRHQSDYCLKRQCNNTNKLVLAWNPGSSELKAGPSESNNLNSNLNIGEKFPLDKISQLAGDFKERRSARPSSELVESEGKLPWTISHGFVRTAKNFSGRETELEELNSHFNSNEDLVLVCGFGGIGKTELCRKFANDIPSELNSSSISRVWLHGDSIETLRDSIVALGDKLGMKNESRQTPSEYFDFLASQILAKCSRLLVIVDNVDTVFEEVTKVILSVRSHKGFFIIVTSRSSSVLDSAGITLRLDVLNDDQARHIFQQSITNITNSDADLLCKLLNNYPLALQQAVAYIKQQKRDYRTLKYSVSDYIQEFKRKKSAMLDQKLSKFEHDYELTTLVVRDMTLEKMSEDALEIMKVLAYFEPDKILINFLEKVVSKLYPSNCFEQSLNMIHNYSLVKVEHKSLRIHRLVQEVIRLKILDSEFPKSLFETALLGWVGERKSKFIGVLKHDRQQLNTICKFAFNCELKRYDDFEVVVQFLFKVGRIDCAVEYTKLCFTRIQFSSSLDDKGKMDMIEKVALYNMIKGHGDSPYVSNEDVESGNYDKYFINIADNCDLTLLERILKLIQNCFPNNGRMNYEINQVKVKVLKITDVGQRERCIPLCEELLESPYDSLYEDGLSLFMRFKCNNLGFKCALKVKKEMLEKLLEWKRNEMGENHSNTLKVTEMLANVLGGLGDLESALRLWKQLKDFAKRKQLCKSGREALEQSFIIGLYKNKLKYDLKVFELELILGKIDNLMLYEIYTKFTQGDLCRTLRFLTVCEKKLGPNDELTLRIKNDIALKFGNKGKLNHYFLTNINKSLKR